MKLQEIHDLAIDFGIKNDLRPKEEIEKKLERLNSQYKKMPKGEFFEEERLKNPYMDSTIHFDSGKEVKRVMVGIDIDAGELMIAKALKVDAVIAHHPIGKSLVYLGDVMNLQADILAQYGVPINVAESLLRVRISEVARGVNPSNHFKTPMAAENLGISLMNVHTPADNAVATFLKNLIEEKEPEYVDELLSVLEEVPEYKKAKEQGVGPTLFAGSKENRAGKIAITEITGGTEGSEKIYEAMTNAGVGTILAMHQSEKHREAATKAHINAVIAGHISSDNIGMNLFLDELEKIGIEIITCSGLERHSRVKR